jgi:dTMP kinase
MWFLPMANVGKSAKDHERALYHLRRRRRHGQIDPCRVACGSPSVIRRIIVGETRPDLTFILDVPAKEGMRRAAQRRGRNNADRFEAETLAFHEKLRDGFLTLAANEPDRCVLIDATMPKEEVAEQIWRVVTKRLDPATAPIQFEDAVT